eukprot:6719787-Prymnesium_polylepis.1
MAGRRRPVRPILPRVEPRQPRARLDRLQGHRKARTRRRPRVRPLPHHPAHEQCAAARACRRDAAAHVAAMHMLPPRMLPPR